MVQGRCRTGFAPEAFECLRVLRYIIGQELQSDEAAEFGVLSLVDDTHPAPTEFLDDAVVRDGLANHVGFVQRTFNRGPWVLGLDIKCRGIRCQFRRLVRGWSAG